MQSLANDPRLSALFHKLRHLNLSVIVSKLTLKLFSTKVFCFSSSKFLCERKVYLRYDSQCAIFIPFQGTVINCINAQSL